MLNFTDEYIKEYARKRAESIENYVACYLKETELSIKDIELIEESINVFGERRIETIWYCRPKNKRINNG